MTSEEKPCQMATLYGYTSVLKDELPTPAWKEAVWKDGIGASSEDIRLRGSFEIK
jgi:beta-glucosidase